MNGYNGTNISRLKQMADAVKNPHAILAQMANTNPDLATVLQASGGDYKRAFYDLAKKRGVNPDDVLSQLKSIM